MGRVRSAAAVLPALVPGACVAVLAFQEGGFYPESWSVIAFVAAVGLALRVVTVGRPFAGVTPWSGAAIGCLALLGVWTLASASWSHAPGRALVEYGRLLTYLLVLVACASLAPRDRRLAWGIRGVAAAIAAVCVAALVTRLRPDLWGEEAIGGGRLDFPITYWNGLGVLAGVGVVLGLHLSASAREPMPVRALASALAPVAACTVYFTLSRGGIAATAIGVAVYLLVGFSSATPGALLALAPACALALTRAYDADVLVTPDFASAPGRAQGRDVVVTLLIAAGLAMGLRLLTLPLDGLLARTRRRARLPRAARFGAPAVAVLAALVVAIAVGAPGEARRQVDTFMSRSPAASGPDPRARLLVVNNNGRIAQWEVALDAWRREPLRGHGAGTFQSLWNLDRPNPGQVLDAHSLYLEVLGELGLVGLVLLAGALLSVLAGLARRLRGPRRPELAAVLAATLAWAVHAGVDWDWELAAVTVWVFGLGGLALAADPDRAAMSRPLPRLLRLVIALGCLLLALAPAALWRSQTRLQVALQAFEAGDCPAAVDAALDSLSAVGVRPEPWELIAYCDARGGQPRLAVDAARAAVRRDPADWEFHYTLAIVQGATGGDPRRAAAQARRLNPRQPEARMAVRAFRTGGRRAWERRARKLPLYIK